ncbi:hypothetical protein AAFF_G00245660 [Aldrovandia affinis]|uniref:Uncharacterized protein n=1 Tax=Aldrovandia affinis TaxID=143900 RepID=A0AAD7WTR1_9TELE|nr:hypothetical protein AAFF_G00245660 [Aldrovandia affinis]
MQVGIVYHVSTNIRAEGQVAKKVWQHHSNKQLDGCCFFVLNPKSQTNIQNAKSAPDDTQARHLVLARWRRHQRALDLHIEQAAGKAARALQETQTSGGRPSHSYVTAEVHRRGQTRCPP